MVRVARKHAGYDGEVALSIFVNPLQFEPGSDYERYPRLEKTDEEFCRNAGVDLLFRPSVAEMYADDRTVFVEETSLSNKPIFLFFPDHDEQRFHILSCHFH